MGFAFEDKVRTADVQITILGAGIAGLSAAHELIERGFKVQVIERNSGPLDEPLEGPGLDAGTNTVDVGGIARTQWSTPPDQDGKMLLPIHGSGDNLLDLEVPDERTEFSFAVPLRLFPTAAKPVVPEGAIASERIDINNWLHHHCDLKVNKGIQLVRIEYEYRRRDDVALDDAAKNTLATVTGVKRSYERMQHFCQKVWDFKDVPKGYVVLPASQIVYTLTGNQEIEDLCLAVTRGTAPGVLLRIHPALELVPGEHGFRFFPGFYRHLRDTMRRTPIYDPALNRFTDRTVHDNLVEIQWQVVSDPTREHPSAFVRKPINSLAEMFEQYRTLRRELGFRESDMLRFALRMARFATSSSVRREARYEDLSWWDFLSLRDLTGNPKTPVGGSLTKGGGPEVACSPGVPASERPERLNYGRRIERALLHSPRALVAMDAKITDSRTQGNLSVQLAMDQFGLHTATDSTLNAPTSEAWFTPWRQYLAHQGVKFFVGEVTLLTEGEEGVELTIAWPGGEQPPEVNLSDGRSTAKQHYVVCAMDSLALARVLQPNEKFKEHPGALTKLSKSLERLVRTRPFGSKRDPEDLAEPIDEWDRYQTLTGIQLFFKQRTSFADGHLYYGDSPWGLSAVSQVQYWRPYGTVTAQRRMYGNLSVDIGSWREGPPIPPWLADLVLRARWSAILRVLRQSELRSKVPDEKRFELFDDAIQHLDAGMHRVWRKYLEAGDNDVPGKRHLENDLAAFPAMILQTWQSTDPEALGKETLFPPMVTPSVLVRDAIAEGVRKQVQWSMGTLAQLRDETVPEILYHHLDDYIQFDHREGKILPRWNRSPYLINLVSDWDARPPGEPWSPNDPKNRRRRAGDKGDDGKDGKEGYPLWGAKTGTKMVLAGAYTRTFTRMGTMESANESGRHAANAILDDLSSQNVEKDATNVGRLNVARSLRERTRPAFGPHAKATRGGDFCEIWDPEEHEFSELRFLKKIDEELFYASVGKDELVRPRGRRGGELAGSQITRLGRDEYPDDVPDGAGLPNGGGQPSCPHLFDLLKLDALPDRIDQGERPEVIFKLLESILGALRPGEGRTVHSILADFERLGFKLGGD